jgi:hypothetical protein
MLGSQADAGESEQRFYVLDAWRETSADSKMKPPRIENSLAKKFWRWLSC